MSKRIFFIQIIILLSLINLYFSSIELKSSNSYYYDEKYFRLLTNNYAEINPGNEWKNLSPDGIGFQSTKDFGSIILLKDWSMHNFKLTKIFFRKECSFKYEDFTCDAEMWLYHTKDNQYYPPGRRIYIPQNFFIIVIPFVKNHDDNPANDLILDFFNLERYSAIISEGKKTIISPKKPIKLHHIIQNQPSYLFEGKYNSTETLFMVFTQYHFLSQSMFDKLNQINVNNFNTDVTLSGDGRIYRNMRKLDEIKPKATLMAYNKGSYLKNIITFIFLFLF